MHGYVPFVSKFVHPQQMPPEGVIMLLALVYPGRCLRLLTHMSIVIDIFFAWRQWCAWLEANCAFGQEHYCAVFFGR